MTAEETALELFRTAAANVRVARKIRNADTFGLRFAVASLARIIRAIRAEREETERKLEAIGNLAIMRTGVWRSAHCTPHTVDALIADAYNRGLRDFARRVQGACLFELGVQLHDTPGTEEPVSSYVRGLTHGVGYIAELAEDEAAR